MKSMKGLLIVLMCMSAATSFGVNVVISGTSSSNDQNIIDFFDNGFEDTTVTYGDYSNPANIPVGTDVFVIGRKLSSSAYANATNSATFNALNIPVVCFTSYIARLDSDRWGWHSGGAVGALLNGGSETTVTAAGASVLGFAEGTHDFVADAGSMWALGDGTVGTGNILATATIDSGTGIGILAAGWFAGEQSAGGVTFNANRLLWNAFEFPTLGHTADGQAALTNAVEAYTGLVAVPEPATMAILGLGVLLIRRKR